MDYIRTAYHCKMRLHPEDPDRLTDVVWYRAEPDAKLFPDSHRFASLEWEERAEEGPLGETVERGEYYTGWNWRGYKGQSFCGTIAQYQRGILPGEAGCTEADCGERILFDEVHNENWAELLEPPVGVVEVLAPAPIGDDCPLVGEVPEMFQLTIAGATNRVCPDCTTLNGAEVLNQVSACLWRSGILSFDCGGIVGLVRWYLEAQNPGPLGLPAGWWLYLRTSVFGNIAYWYAPFSAFDPFGSNTITFVFGSDDCNWPATVQVDARI